MIALVGIVFGLGAVWAFVHFFEGPPARETDDEKLARRHREVLAKVNASYDESHPYWWN